MSSNLIKNKVIYKLFAFLPSWGCVHATVWMDHMDANKIHRVKA